MPAKFISTLVLSFILLFTFGCSSSVDDSNRSVGGDLNAWLIPADEIFDGGPGKDGIPALLDPVLESVEEAVYLKDAFPIIAVRVGNEVRGYPHAILDWHEIINDRIGSELFAVTYCPLTGSATIWDRNVGGSVTTFGVSGLLYNTNLIPYDRSSGSNWSQFALQCVNGTLIGERPTTRAHAEMPWVTFKQMFPQAKMASRSTGFNRPYGNYPYGRYRTDDNMLLFPINHDDPRIPRKERVLGIIGVDSTVYAYRFSSFGSQIKAITATLDGRRLIVIGDESRNFAVAYDRTFPDGTVLSFTALQNSLPAIVKDNEGTTWDALGYGLSGPRAGTYLTSTESFIGYWFAWAAFYPHIKIQTTTGGIG